MIVRELDGELLFSSSPEENSSRVAEVGDEASIALDEYRDRAGARTRIIDSTALQLLLSVLKHLREVLLDIFLPIQSAKFSLMRTLLQLGGDVIISSLAGLPPRRAVAIVYCKKVGIISEIL